MKLASPIRGALIGGILATLLNPLLLLTEALLLFGTGLLTPRQHFIGSDDPHEFVVLGTILLCIPELIGGMVFGAGFAAIGRGGRWTGAIAGATLWSLIPLAYAIPDFAHYLQVEPSMQPPQPNWKQEYFEYDVVYPAAWIAKELLTGLIIGYFVGRDVARRKAIKT
jgi:hypothetical protein